MPVQDIYPVGSIYLSVSSTSPASLFGGTWEQLRNRFLLGASNENAAGSTGGEASSTLSTENLPAHTHTMATGAAQPEGVGAPQSIYTAIVDKYTTASGHWYNQVRSGTNENANGESFSNMPPYLAVYMWKRVA
jgi:microcystin-dependent protein